MARDAFWARAKAVAQAIGWIAGFVVVGGGLTLLLAQVLGIPSEGSWGLAVSSAYGVAGFGLATWFVGRVADRHAWSALGWGEPRRLVPRLGAGLGLGAGMAIVAVLASVAAGAHLAGDAGVGPFAPLAPLAIGLMLAALVEELVFRGYPLRRLAEGTGPGVATAILAVGFGAAHLGNPAATAFSTANIALAAGWLAAAFFSRGAMPLAWGLHVGWNAGLAGLEAPVSGYPLGELPFVDYTAGPHRWFDGGPFGPEGGLVGTVIFVAGTALVLGAGRRLPRPREWFA